MEISIDTNIGRSSVKDLFLKERDFIKRSPSSMSLKWVEPTLGLTLHLAYTGNNRYHVYVNCEDEELIQLTMEALRLLKWSKLPRTEASVRDTGCAIRSANRIDWLRRIVRALCRIVNPMTINSQKFAVI